VVVSSLTPRIASRCLVNQPGLSASRLRICANRNSSSSLVGHGDQVVLARLDPRAHQDVERGIAAVVQDHVRGAFAVELEDPVGIGPSNPPASRP
jgi:hypothetical protein